MKKRILSLILALSMVLSVFPLGAFAEGSTQDLVIGSDGYPVGSEGGSKDCNGGGNGNDWEYYSKSRILCLNGGTFDLSTTEPVECKISSAATITGGTFNGAVENIDGTISGGIFNGTVTNASTGKISGGTFAGSVANGGTIENGTFEGQVTNDSNGEISGGTFQSTGSVTNEGTITGNGTFNGTVTNSRYIENGTFNGTVTNSRYIKNGTFNGTVTNNDAIHGGIFAGSVNNSEGCHIYGGVFNGKTGLDGVTVLISITVASGAKITEVNGVSAAWKPYVVVTSFTETREVIITADTEIFSLNGYPIDGSPYSSSYPDTTDKKTVKFTELGVLDNEMVLNGAITHGGDLVMENGYPKASIGGKYSCEGKGWTYSEKDISNLTGKLTLKSNSGTYDFSYINPQTKAGGSAKQPVLCEIEIQSGATITGGTFEKEVRNSGTIERGTFAGGVTNSGTIKNGTFACSVTNYSNIESKGTFNGTVENHGGTISSGTFKGTVQNWYGTISGGTFHEKVLNSNGEITGGTFAAGLSANHNTVTGGVFNGKTGLTDALHVTVTNGSVDKVNGVVTTGTAWDLYSYAGTTMTITASTEIYSLNGQPIGTGNSSYPDENDKTTVTFTMPNENVVLSGAITCTDLVMKKGYPEDSNGGTTPCKGNGWTYSKKDASNPKGKLTLTDGTYDFSYTYPQNSNGAGAEPVACAVETQLRVKITGGTFEGEVINNDLGVISGGTFHEKVSNSNGMITGGTFKSSVTSKGYGRIFGGVFNGNATLTNVTGLHSITVASGAKIKEVNGMSADWDPYVVVTENATTNEVIITADTEIFSLNGKSIGDGNCKSSYDGSDYKTVKFTMPGEPVVLNGAITCTDLVMKGGYPEASNEGKISCSGTGWEYIKKSSGSTNTGTLYLMSGSEPFDFNFADPTTKITRTDAAVKCAIESYATISGGIFDGTVTNNAGGEISDGTFKGDVENSGYIEKGTFNKEVSNINGNISNGTFNETVTNDAGGTIYGGTFAGGVNNKNDRIYGGVFNGNATLTNVTGLHSITVASNAKIEKVNGVSADWAPYVVTSNATTKEVTITADTEIFSLNGQPIAESSYGVDKKTVTFTMPDDDVVLNGAITSTDLVMENGYPKDSNGGKNPCKGDGWEYIKNDPTNGDMLLLTGSNQTGGLFDFSTIGDGLAVECNVFVGKPTAITGGEFNGKVFNNSGILGGTFHGPVDNTTMGRIENGTFHGAVENNGMIENGTFHDEVKNNGTINDGAFNGKVENNSVINSGTFHDEVVNTTMGRIENGTFHGAVENNGTINGGTFNGAVTDNGTISGNITGSGTLNGKPITKTEPTPEPEPTTYTVTVIGGTIDGKTSVSAKENDTLTVVLDQNDIPDGMTFDLWSISSDKLSGDINVDYRAEAMTFQMPAEDVTIRAQYRSAEIIEDAAPSPLATAATIAVGGAAAGIVVWQGVSLGVDLYLANALPQGVPVPTDRRALALLLWETAGKPEVALPTLYGDIPAEEIELQKATRWAIQNGLMDAADKKDASFFDPDHYVTKMDVFGAWLRLKKLLGTT